MGAIGIHMDDERRSEVVGCLEDIMVDLITLGLNGKQAHWHVTGRSFLPVHDQLDRLVSDARAWTDRVAERAIALGMPVDGRPGTIAGTNALKEFPPGFVTDVEVVTEIGRQVDTVAERIRAHVDALGEADRVSQDLVIGILAGLEHHLWMLHAQLAGEMQGPMKP